MLWKLFLIMKLTLLQQSVHSLPHLYLLGREACIPCSFFLPNFSEPSYKECARWVFAKGAQTYVKSLCWSATERVKTQQTDAPLPCAFCLLSALSILEHCNHLLTLWKETKIIRKDRKLWCYMWYKHGKSIQECIFFFCKKNPNLFWNLSKYQYKEHTENSEFSCLFYSQIHAGRWSSLCKWDPGQDLKLVINTQKKKSNTGILCLDLQATIFTCRCYIGF